MWRRQSSKKWNKLKLIVPRLKKCPKKRSKLQRLLNRNLKRKKNRLNKLNNKNNKCKIIQTTLRSILRKRRKNYNEKNKKVRRKTTKESKALRTQIIPFLILMIDPN